MKRDRSGALYVLLDTETLEALDGWAEALNLKGGGPTWTRTAVVRAVIGRALLERAAKGKAP